MLRFCEKSDFSGNQRIRKLSGVRSVDRKIDKLTQDVCQFFIFLPALNSYQGSYCSLSIKVDKECLIC